jgi:hypothetical protein
MAEKYPHANIHYVEGAAGDAGLDMFCGDLACGPTVWQCKSFQVSFIGKSQKQQIRESLKTACSKFSPRLWVLCLNMDLDTKVHRWFQALRSSYLAKGTTIDLVQGSDIIRELIFRHSLRAHYFPGESILDEVRKLAASVWKGSGEQLEMLVGESVEQYVERLTAKDARFRYEITLGGERGPEAFPPPPEPGLVATLTDGERTTKAYAWDAKALALDPVGFSITVSGAGIDKMDSLLRRGHAQEFTAEEIREFDATLPLLSELPISPRESGLIVKQLPSVIPIPVRLSFSSGAERVVYELVNFHVTRAGTDEVEISTLDDELPMQIRFVFPTPQSQGKTCKAHFAKRFAGKDVCRVRKAVAALLLLKAGSTIEIYSLTHGANLAVVEANPLSPNLDPQSLAWLDMLVAISEGFKAVLRLPHARHIVAQESESIALLHAIATGGSLAVNGMRFRLVKSAENLTLFPNLVRVPSSLTMIYPRGTFALFGTELHHSGYGMHLEKFEFDDPQQALLNFEETEVGKSVPLSVRPLAPVRFFLTTQV